MCGKVFCVLAILIVAHSSSAMGLDNVQARDQLAMAQMKQFIDGLSAKIDALEQKISALQMENAKNMVLAKDAERTPTNPAPPPLIDIESPRKISANQLSANLPHIPTWHRATNYLIFSGSVVALGIGIYLITDSILKPKLIT